MLKSYLQGRGIGAGLAGGLSNQESPAEQKTSGKRHLLFWWNIISWIIFFFVSFSFTQVSAPRHVWNYVLITGGPVFIRLFEPIGFFWTTAGIAIVMAILASFASIASGKSWKDWSQWWHIIVAVSCGLFYYAWSYELAYFIGTWCVFFFDRPCFNSATGANAFALCGVISYSLRCQFIVKSGEMAEIKWNGSMVRLIKESAWLIIAVLPIPYIIWAAIGRAMRGQVPPGYDVENLHGSPGERHYYQEMR